MKTAVPCSPRAIPKTKPQLNAVLRQLHKLDADALIDRAVEGIEWRMIEP